MRIRHEKDRRVLTNEADGGTRMVAAAAQPNKRRNSGAYSVTNVRPTVIYRNSGDWPAPRPELDATLSK